MVKALAAAKTFKDKEKTPTLSEVRDHLRTCFEGADKWAHPFYSAMVRNGWKDRKRHAVRDWRRVAYRYASICFQRERGIQ